jgi:hypothetical protein
MKEALPAAWLVGGDGTRRRIGDSALLLGRDPSCDLVLSDKRASGRQALLRSTAAGLELHPLGRNPTEVNGVVMDRMHLLASGDVIEVPGGRFQVEVEQDRRSDEVWLLRVGGASHRIPSRALTVGCAPHDDLVVPDLPPGALTFFRAGDGLLLEVTEEGFTLDGEPLEPDEVHPVGPNRTLAWGPVHMQVDTGSSVSTPTTHLNQMPILRRLSFQYLPTGGRLTVDLTTQVIEVGLSELRCRLVVALMQPPDPYEPGEIVPDELILSMVWPRQPERSHYDINTLVHRLRKDMLKAGLDPTQLIERARGGGGARLRITEECVVEVE